MNTLCLACRQEVHNLEREGGQPRGNQVSLQVGALRLGCARLLCSCAQLLLGLRQLLGDARAHSKLQMQIWLVNSYDDAVLYTRLHWVTAVCTVQWPHAGHFTTARLRLQC